MRRSNQHITRGLYAITSPHYGPLLPQVEQALQGGARLIQYRDKQANSHTREHQARALLALCKAYQVPLIINDDVALAKHIAADGVHLGQSDHSVTAARRLLGNTAIIGVTCHNSTALAQKAIAAGANYLALGCFFPSTTKPNAPIAPLDCISSIRSISPLPLVAIGGITKDNAPLLLVHNTDMIAVSHGLWSAPCIRHRAQQFAALFVSPVKTPIS